MHSMLLYPIKTRWAPLSSIISHMEKASKLRVFSSMFDEDEIPVNQLFRTFQEMPSFGTESPSTQYRQNIGCWCRKWMPHLGFTGNG